MANCKGGKIWTCNMVDMFFKFKYWSHGLRLHWRLRSPKYWRILNDSLDKVFLSDSCLCFSVTLHNLQGILPYRSKAMIPQFILFFLYGMIPFLWMFLIVAIHGWGIQEAEHIKYKWLHLGSCWFVLENMSR